MNQLVRNDVISRMRVALDECGVGDIDGKLLNALCLECETEAWKTPHGRNAMQWDPKTDEVIYVDLAKTIAISASIVAAVGALVATANVAAGAVAIAAVCALKNARSVTLPRAAGAICIVLIDAPNKAMDRSQLFQEAQVLIARHGHVLSDAEFDAAVTQLKNLGCLEQTDDSLRALERIAIRF